MDVILQLYLCRPQGPPSLSANHPDRPPVDPPKMPLVKAVADGGAALTLAVQVHHPQRRGEEGLQVVKDSVIDVCADRYEQLDGCSRQLVGGQLPGGQLDEVVGAAQDVVRLALLGHLEDHADVLLQVLASDEDVF